MPNANIEGHDCTLFFDYDCHLNGVLKQLTDAGKIEWLRLRMKMIFLDPINKIADRRGTVYPSLEHPAAGSPMTAMLMVTSLLLNGMEALGSFLTNSNNNNKRFYSFVNKYMSNWNVMVTTKQHGTKRLSEILWESYRNGLAHSFAILHAGIEDDQNNATHHFNNDVIQIDVWKLMADLQGAIDNMFADMQSNNGAKKMFMKRFNKVYTC